MNSFKYKAKQFLFLVAKILVVTLALWFIYKRLSESTWLSWDQFMDSVDNRNVYGIIAISLFLAFVNRFFEILKWQNLSSLIRPVSVYEATKQELSALVFSIFTPNGIGEYGAKLLFFQKDQAKDVIFLNLICNGIQMVLTIILGTIGLVLLGHYYWFGGVLLAIAIGWFLVFVLKKVSFKGYSISRLLEEINLIPKFTHRKNIILGIGRYSAFTLQQYFLLSFFGVDLPFIEVIATITSVYFLASSLPNFQLFDFMVKGGVSVFFFGMLGVNEWVVMLVSLLMWVLNVVIPVIFGSFFVLGFKLKPKENTL